MTDKNRMDFLEDCVMNHSCISAKRDYDCHVDSPTFGDLETVTLFTIPSQHVKGVGFRGAIDAAIEASKKKK